MKEVIPVTYNDSCINAIRRFPILYGLVCRYGRTLKFLISGGIAAAIDLSLLFFLVHYIHMWYLYAAAIANLIAIGVSFTMQKFWTFRNLSLTLVHRQFILYMIIQIGNFFLNAFLIYIFVQSLSLWYMLAQCIAFVLIAVLSFNFYRHVFKS